MVEGSILKQKAIFVSPDTKQKINASVFQNNVFQAKLLTSSIIKASLFEVTNIVGSIARSGPEGPEGQVGPPGTDGEDGREVELSTTATHIVWRYAGDTSWTDLVALSLLVGPKGDTGNPGADGTPIELRKTATYIQWHYVSDEDWTDLVALIDIKGDKGDPGESGITVHNDLSGLQGGDSFSSEYYHLTSSEHDNIVVSYKDDFEIADWTLSGDSYYLDMAHNLGTLSPAYSIYESSAPVHVNDSYVVDENTLRLYIPAVPDLRFAGKISITR